MFPIRFVLSLDNFMEVSQVRIILTNSARGLKLKRFLTFEDICNFTSALWQLCARQLCGTWVTKSIFAIRAINTNAWRTYEILGDVINSIWIVRTTRALDIVTNFLDIFHFSFSLYLHLFCSSILSLAIFSILFFHLHSSFAFSFFFLSFFPFRLSYSLPLSLSLYLPLPLSQYLHVSISIFLYLFLYRNAILSPCLLPIQYNQVVLWTR